MSQKPTSSKGLEFSVVRLFVYFFVFLVSRSRESHLVSLVSRIG